jgi:hypothetical protein
MGKPTYYPAQSRSDAFYTLHLGDQAAGHSVRELVRRVSWTASGTSDLLLGAGVGPATTDPGTRAEAPAAGLFC